MWFSTYLTLSFMFSFGSGYKILAIVAFNGNSHFLMFEKLMKGLAQKGHEVDVVSHFPQKEKISNYNDLSLAGSLPDLKNNLTYEFAKEGSSFMWVKNLLQRSGNNICELLGHPVLQKLIHKNSSYDLVIVQIFFAPCYLAFGRHLQIPMVGLVTSQLYEWMNEPFGNPDNPSFIPGGSLSYTSHMHYFQRFINTVNLFTTKIIYNYYTADQKKYVEKYFGSGFPDICDLQKDVALVLVNSHYTLNGIRPMTPGVVEVGGIHIQDDNQKLPPVIQEWLDGSHHGCVYVSFGSMIKFESFPKKALEAFYATFRSVAPIRFLIKIAKDDELPIGLPENVKTYSWLPQVQVLKHKNLKAFVSHGGLLSALESVHFGVPIIGIPLFVDQFSNVNNYVQRNCAIALDIDSLNEENLKNAILKILQDPIYRTSIDSFRKLYLDRPAKPLDEAIFWVEYVIRNGNILKSSAVDLTWWQLNLLDVYVGLFVIIFITSYLIYFLIRKLFSGLYRLLVIPRSFIRREKME